MYHLCFTSHQEVLCRRHSDYVRLFNSMAQAAINTGSMLVTYNIMSNHLHLALITSDTGRFMQRLRSSYTQMFNDRYRRTGMLGDPHYFILELKGRHHVTAALSYILRNPSHHRLCANLFAYPYSPVLLYFNNHRSHIFNPDNDISDARSLRTIRRKNQIPGNVRFDVSGMLDMAAVTNTEILEGYFGSYKAFQYGLVRTDYDRWEKEQANDRFGAAPVTLASMEPHLPAQAVTDMMTQNMAWLKEASITDDELCSLIDGQYLSDFHKHSYTELTVDEKIKIAGHIRECRYVQLRQLGRCLGIRPELLM